MLISSTVKKRLFPARASKHEIINIIHLETLYSLSIFNWNSLHKRLISHCKTEFKEKEENKYEKYRKADEKEPDDDKCMMTLNVNQFRS